MCQPLIDGLIAAGIDVTHDWTRDPSWDRDPSTVTVADEVSWVKRRIDCVRKADILWYAAPMSKSEGSHGQLVLAIGLGKTVVASGQLDAHGRLFPSVAQRAFGTHDKALAYIIALNEAP